MKVSCTSVGILSHVDHSGHHFSFPCSCHWLAAALTPPACHSLPTGISESMLSHNPKACLASAIVSPLNSALQTSPC